MEFELSDEQKNIITNYQGGFASVLATPGAGKTTLVSYLVKELLFQRKVKPKSVLVLTLTESASKEFKQRTVALIGKSFPTPEFMTIHSFCKRILDNYNTKYAGLEVLNEPEKHQFLENILASKGLEIKNPEDREDFDYIDIFKRYVIPLYRKNPAILEVIKQRLTNDTKSLMRATGISNLHFKYLTLIPEIIEEYENYLSENERIDFDMMINETYNVIKKEPTILEQLRKKYTYILEDEAQDSNEIQGEILKLVAGEKGNYLRVGDPNQSIFTTFTGADYKGLIDFYNNFQQFEITQSNRSYKDIVEIANYLVRCFSDSFPSHKVQIKEGKFNPKYGKVSFLEFETVEEELENIVMNAQDILKKNRKASFAILTRTNNQAREFYNRITNNGFPCILHGNKEDNFFANETVKKVSYLIYYMLYPYNYKAFIEVLKIFQKDNIVPEFFAKEEAFIDALKSLSKDELLYFGDDSIFEDASKIAKKLVRLIDGVYFSVTEILQLINNHFILDNKEKNIIAVLNKMWLRVSKPHSDITDFYTWLRKYMDVKISQDINFSEEDFSSPETIHILTIHKAKGLQWDNVFLPHFTKNDFKDNSWKGFKNDFKSIIFALAESKNINEIKEKVVQEEVHESRRLAYVGITRAKKNLFITSPDYTFDGKERSPAEIFYILRSFQNSQNDKKN
ncbi:MAG: ATP-dependent helicase [Candidatus Sericytochromatia bacterium]